MGNCGSTVQLVVKMRLRTVQEASHVRPRKKIHVKQTKAKTSSCLANFGTRSR